MTDTLNEANATASTMKAVHGCLERIWQRFRMRARLFLLEEGELVLVDCVGQYGCGPQIGLKVHPQSIVWEVFMGGEAKNLTEADSNLQRPHTLPEPIAIKAIIPLCAGYETETPRKWGALVIDSGDPNTPINDKDFEYMKIMGALISELLEHSALLEKINRIERDRDAMAREFAHIARNRFSTIGGFARRLLNSLQDPQHREWAGIIVEEIDRGERDLNRWMEMHERKSRESS